MLFCELSDLDTSLSCGSGGARVFGFGILGRSNEFECSYADKHKIGMRGDTFYWSVAHGLSEFRGVRGVFYIRYCLFNLSQLEWHRFALSWGYALGLGDARVVGRPREAHRKIYINLGVAIFNYSIDLSFLS